MSDFNNASKVNSINQFNLKKAISIYLNKWFWFVLSCLICLTAAYFKLRYTAPEYSASAKIMLLDDKESSAAGAAFKDLPLFSEKEEGKVEDEIEVIKSRAILKNVVKDLKLNIQYFSKGRFNDSEIYKNSPITINFIDSDSIIDETNFSFFIKVNSNKNFQYKLGEEDAPKTYAFGEKISAPFGDIFLTPNSNINKSKGNQINVIITPVSSVVEALKNNVFVFQERESSKILNLSLQDPIENKAKDVINSLIDHYIDYSKELKNSNSRNTANLIDERVELTATDLVSVDQSIVSFKTGNKLTDVTSEAEQFISTNTINEQQLDQSNTQLRQLNYMESALGSDNSYTPVPSNLGLGDPSITALSAKYNELIENRARLMKSAGAKNSVVLEIDQTLKGLRQNLSNSIQNSKRSLAIQISSLENQSNKINSKIFSVPAQESKLRSIERKQGIKESLYLYLLQKREEAAISLTATSPNAKILESAHSTGSPVSPNKKMTYIAAFFISLLIPFGIIYSKDLLDTKIHNKEDLVKEIKDITVLGEIPRVNKRSGSLLIEKNDRSILSESFRIIRTNFEYVRKGREVKNYDNVIFVTSTIGGEGKSFFGINSALTIANTDKRVLLMGADIRNPQIQSFIKKQIKTSIPDIGFTEFLVDKSISASDVIKSYSINDIKIDILLSGKVPPNPAELLMTDRVKELFDYASEHYDMVVVDTAPAMLVTDTLLISQYAGHTIYLTRADYTEKQILNYAKELYENKKLNGMMLVINDVNQSNLGYGGKYGYYGAPKKKNLFRKIFR